MGVGESPRYGQPPPLRKSKKKKKKPLDPSSIDIIFHLTP